MFMFDGPAIFKNRNFCFVTKGLKVHHRFILAYCPWSNKVVKSLADELLRIRRAVLSELHIGKIEYSGLSPIARSILNNSFLQKQGSDCPITAFIGHEQMLSTRIFLQSKKSLMVSFSDTQASWVSQKSQRLTQEARLVTLSFTVQLGKASASCRLCSVPRLAKKFQGLWVSV